MRTFDYVVLAALLALGPIMLGEDYHVDNPAKLQEIADTLQPGDSLILGAGYWENVWLILQNDGTREAPITLRAESPGAAVLSGATHLAISGSHIVVEGLHFKNAYPPVTSRTGSEEGEGPDALIDFMANPEEYARDSRITNCHFEACNPSEDRRYHWVRLLGLRNRVDHCRFEGQDHDGVTVQVRLDIPEAEHRIDHNYFFDRKPGDGNGYECVQIGQSWASMESGRCIVENNIFESCDGETEIISSKTCDNVIRGNLFLRSAGTLTIRHGNRTTVEGNVFIGDGKEGAGGIRIIGEDHRVIRNYFQGINSYTGGVIVLYCGIPDGPLNGYAAAHRAVVADNILIHSKGNVFYLNGGFGSRNRTLLAEGVTIKGNVVVHQPGFSDVTVAGYLPDINVTGNFFSGGELGPAAGDDGFKTANLSLVDESNGLKSIKNDDTGQLLPPKPPVPPLRSEVGVSWIP